MRPHGTPPQLEMRRRRAIALLQSGKSYLCVAATLSASLSSVVRWAQTYRKEGLQGLQPKPIPGRPPRLSPAHKAKLERILLCGPLKAGYATDLWTLKRVAQVIELHFGVRYHPCHIWRLLVGIGWSCQKPERRDVRRDEEGIARWKRYKWPRIKKSPRTWCPPGFPG